MTTTQGIPHACRVELAQLGFKIIRVLGKGSWGVVVKATHNDQPHEPVAIKIIVKSVLKNQIDKINLQREIEAMTELSHDNIITCIAVQHTEAHLYLVLEYCSGGDLLTFLQESGAVPESEAKEMFRPLVKAVLHSHKNGFVHRDIKLENCFLTKDNTVLLGDWGFARKFDNTPTIKEFCGSLHYASPEIVRGAPYRGPEVDMWSLGVTLFCITTGTLPFVGNHQAIMQQIVSGRVSFPSDLSSSLKSLISGLMNANPEARLTAEQALSHPWLKEETKFTLPKNFFANDSASLSSSSSSSVSTSSSSSSSSSCDENSTTEQPKLRKRTSWENMKAVFKTILKKTNKTK